MLKAIVLLLASVGLSFGQASLGGGHGQSYPTTPRWQAIYVLPSGTNGVITLQQVAYPAPKTANLEMGWVYCANACSFTLEQNGSAATTGAITPEGLNNSGKSQLTAYAGTNGGNNVGTGAFVSAPYYLAAGQMVFLDLTNMIVPINGGTGANVTLRESNSSAGIVELTLQWTEQ